MSWGSGATGTEGAEIPDETTGPYPGDGFFGDDGGVSQPSTVTGDASSGYRISLTVRIDTSTTPTTGPAPGGGEQGGRRPGSASGTGGGLSSPRAS